MSISHQPVMVDESVNYLVTIPGGIYVDCTVGTGGHSFEICKRMAYGGELICLDIDSSSIRLAEERLSSFKDRIKIIKESYVNLDKVLKGLGISKVNGILLDLGLSSYQLESSGRGFSFLRDEPLDMRMGEERGVTASELINTISVEELQGLLWRYAQERWAKLIARAIVEKRQKEPITSSRQLALLIESTIPTKYHPRKIHPATKTFQSLRIAVNGELQNIESFLEKVPLLLQKGGRLVVISYHSLEDRLVKRAFRSWEKKEIGPRKLPVFHQVHPPLMKESKKGGLRPGQAEVKANPRSRSAIMRTGERV
ncbi:MAG TPA: 16S rRNA (cytosine(1402)-N(4))-methyltransferase RsmH [Desulfatiglandales bacterium]|nr:16S rRNA (cytosine(1402)-N(4))-methyltransferase RsmH [Desulfatiglandales bacterium]